MSSVFGFYAFCTVFVVLLFLSVSFESLFASLIVLIGAGLIAHSMLKYDILKYAPDSIGGWVGLVLIYLALGGVWSVYKFYIEYKEVIHRVAANKEFQYRIMKSNHPEYTAEQLATEWNKYVDERCPKAMQMKESICVWVMYWPISCFFYVVGDLLHDITMWVYDQFSYIYESIAIKLKDSIKD